ncbi:hyaluronate lyase [Arthrobacter sp. MWB30]|nr:hyaluronate lyase [Arthrobacter sp. MWB30]
MALVSAEPVVIEVQLDGHGHQKNLTLGTCGAPPSRSREPCRTAV